MIIPKNKAYRRLDRSKLNHYGDLCRRIRESLGLTIREMSELTGYANTTIINFENGENNNLLLYMYYINLEEEINNNLFSKEDMR
jgi:transcriptional regulator with XRE-family HTH domain